MHIYSYHGLLCWIPICPYWFANVTNLKMHKHAWSHLLIVVELKTLQTALYHYSVSSICKWTVCPLSSLHADIPVFVSKSLADVVVFFFFFTTYWTFELHLCSLYSFCIRKSKVLYSRRKCHSPLSVFFSHIALIKKLILSAVNYLNIQSMIKIQTILLKCKCN